MILNSNFVLVNEVVNQHDIAMSNFSPLSNDSVLVDNNVVVKRGGTTVIDKSSMLLPVYIRDLLNNTTHTDLTNLFILSDLTDEYYLTESQAKKLGELVLIDKKKFIRIEKDLMNIFGNPKWVIYPVTKDEIVHKDLSDIVRKKQFKQIDKETFLTWY